MPFIQILKQWIKLQLLAYVNNCNLIIIISSILNVDPFIIVTIVKELFLFELIEFSSLYTQYSRTRAVYPVILVSDHFEKNLPMDP